MDNDTTKQAIQVKSILEDIVREAGTLYQHIKDRPDVTSATKKRLLTVHSTILAKVLDRLADLQKSDSITNHEIQVAETSDFISDFMKHRARVVTNGRPT